jgi:hypothetical protein
LVASAAVLAGTWSLAAGRLTLAGVSFVALLASEKLRWWFRSGG